MNERKGILVVDDTLSALKLLADTLIEAGYTVRPTNSGERALASAMAEPPELILLDLRMPVMDGFEVCRRLKAQESLKNIPVLFLSAATEIEERVNGFSLGAVDFITKPFQREELLARVRTHLELSRLQSRLGVLVEQRTEELNAANTLLQHELSERKQAEVALQESERRLSNIFDFLPDPTLAIDVEGKVIAWNRAMEKITGISASEILGKGNNEYSLPFYGNRRPILVDYVMSQEPVDTTKYSNVQREGDQLVGEGLTPALKGGSAYLWAIASVLRNSQGKVVGAIESIRDITSRKQTLDSLKEERDRAQSYLDTASVLFLALNQSREVTLINCKGCEILGYPEDELLRKNWLDLCVPSEARLEIDAAYEKVLNGEERDCYHQNLILTKAGDVRIMAFHTTPIRDVSNAIVGVLSSGEDITEQKKAEVERVRLEEQIRHAQKMDTIGRLAGGVAHDFNNLLTGMYGYLDIALQDLTAEDPLSEQLQEIRKCADRAASLTHQLLAFSRRQVIQPSFLSINDLIRDLEKLLPRLLGEEIQLNINLDPSSGIIKIDKGQFDQVLINLVVNAHDAMLDGGEISIETSTITLDQDFCEHQVEAKVGDYVLLKVRDTGTGMSRKTLEHIFEPFFTTKPEGKGTGLGLSIVYGAVQQNGGFILVDSEEGKGTEFRIYFPKISLSPVSPGTAPKVSETPRGSETILLVEDDDLLRTFSHRVLEHLGYKVISFSNGQETIEAVEKSYQKYDLLITDLIMPGLNGRVLAEALVKIRPDLKVLFSSGYVGHVIECHKMQEPGVHFLAKPYAASQLARKIRAVLDGEE